jgi:DNA-binding FrmR family transcriptional regulator
MLDQKKRTRVAQRLNRIAGQVAGIKKMVEGERYCVDILTQIAAARAALSGVGSFVLEDHMLTCVRSAIRKGSGERHIRELMDVFEKF